MAYADQNQGGRKTVSIVIVLLLHAALAYAFITGLAINVIKKAASELKVVDVDEPPPPPPAPPPPPPDIPKNLPPPPIVAPPPIVQAPVVSAPIFAPPPPPVPRPAAPVITAPPPPPAPSQATALKPRGNPGDWLSSDDYPPGAQRDNAEGVTGFKLDVGPDGKVTSCTVTSSSGNGDLDAQACRLLPRRARFSPAKDTAGNGMATTYSGRTRWVLPKD